MKTVFLWIILALSFPAWAVKLDCTQNPETRLLFCFDPKSVSANGEIRAARLYSGGPDEITDSGYRIVTNCKAGYVELRDKRGVVFARDQPQKLHAVMLREKICGATAKIEKRLN